MTRDRRLLLLLGLLMAYGLFVVECKYHQREDADATTEARHRHRHRHESSNRRSHHDPDRRSWQEVDYEYDGDAEEDSMAEDDYEIQSYHDHLRSHQQHAQKSYHGRMFEPRYPARYHGGGYRGSGWYDMENDRRKISPRYNAKNRRYGSGRTYHGRAYSRNHDASGYDDDDDDTKEDFDYERSHRYVEDGGTGDRRFEWRNSRRHASPRRNWRSRTHPGRLDAWRHRLKDRTVDRGDRESRWTENWGRRSNSSSDYKFDSFKEESKSEEDEDYKDHGGLEESDKDDDDDDDDDGDDDEEEEDDMWKNDKDEEEEDDEVEELDNDFYKSKSKAALTYDDIIKRLTSDDPTTARTTVKRDYRNIEDKNAKRENSYRNLKHEPKNVSRLLGPFTLASRPLVNRSHVGTAMNSSVKSAVSDEHKSPKNAFSAAARRNDWQQDRSTAVKTDGTHTKNKRGDLDFDGYMYPADNEKDDLDTAEVEEDSDMQADVTNTGYTDDDDNGHEDEASVDTTSTFTTTRMTATTPKWSVNQHGKNTRPYERGTAAQYNGYQPKNDYPPMSAHSVYKWRTLGSRESVKQTRNNMQQYNKNSEHAAFQEAIEYWKKVNTEGTCKWPRAKVIRVSDSYPDSSVNYYPHCAILHECSDNTGCCKSEALTCVPKKSHPIILTFYTTNVNQSVGTVKLKFYNHTECECQDRDDSSKITQGTHRMNQRDQSISPPQNMKRTSTIKPCKCPKHFTPRRRFPQDPCQCICPENNINCIPFSRGKRLLDPADRLCIETSECAVPNCEFGMYLSWEGKCASRKDMFGATHAMSRQFRNHRRNERRIREG